MAHQLSKQGETVKRIYFLDSSLYAEGLMKDFYEAVHREELIAALPKSWSHYMAELPPVYLEKILACYRNDVQMAIKYSIKPYEGSALLIKATNFVTLTKLSKFLTNYAHNGWKPWVKDLIVKPIYADHFNIIEGDQIKEVAKIIREDIRGQICTYYSYKE